jgi:uncharacterized protein
MAKKTPGASQLGLAPSGGDTRDERDSTIRPDSEIVARNAAELTSDKDRDGGEVTQHLDLASLGAEPSHSGASPAESDSSGGDSKQPRRATGEAAYFDAQEIYIPVHGFVRLSDDEVVVLNHPALQRLGTIYQLGQAHMVFRGATHKRLEHCIGTLGAASLITDNLDRNERRRLHDVKKSGAKDTSAPRKLSDCEKAFIRLSALAHDIGHLPAGHTLEDELGLLGTHDYLNRVTTVLDRKKWPGADGSETLREIIDTYYQKYLPTSTSMKPSSVFIQVIAKNPPDETSALADLEPELRIDVCRDIVGNTICADLLDYLYRDWHHVGKPRFFDHRLLQYFELQWDSHSGKDAFVVSLGQRPKIRNDAISAILDLLESRYQLSETVLFHRTKLAFAAMLERGIQELREAKGTSWANDLVERLLDSSDEEMIDFFLASALGSDPKHPSVEAAATPLTALRLRRVYKNIFTRFSEEYPADVVTRLKFLYARRKTGHTDERDEKKRQEYASMAAAARLKALRLLEADFSLPPGSLVMYCPSSMNPKIAKVKIAIDNEVASFDSWEDQPNRLSGGHLGAQINRFNRLWRVHVFLEARLAAEMEERQQEKLYLLKAAIKELVFPKNSNSEKLRRKAIILARQASSIKDMGLFYDKVIRADTLAARSQTLTETEEKSFPSGAPMMSKYV